MVTHPGAGPEVDDAGSPCEGHGATAPRYYAPHLLRARPTSRSTYRHIVEMALTALRALRQVTKGVPRVTRGLPAASLERFDSNAELNTAITAATARLETLRQTYGDEYLMRPELELCDEMQARHATVATDAAVPSAGWTPVRWPVHALTLVYFCLLWVGTGYGRLATSTSTTTRA